MNIGFIGLGIMGESMCENIVKKHDGDVFVFDFNEAQVDKLVGVGAKKCASSTEVAKNADVIISMVPKSEHSKAVYDEVFTQFQNASKNGKFTIGFLNKQLRHWTSKNSENKFQPYCMVAIYIIQKYIRKIQNQNNKK